MPLHHQDRVGNLRQSSSGGSAVIPKGFEPAESIRLHPLERYYRFHSRIYDATRWSFLFGRDKLVRIITKLIVNLPGFSMWGAAPARI